ncbi:MAG TPA: adenylate/guanylate cyclase domain-containing protein [Burkholderiaceae bacterium]|nr:adenylate/guanylate cyclase domain-containing protein [Burkholderiaceae bacterium]
MSGFTTISEGLDPEDVRALQTDLFNALRGVVERFDAFVEKFVGDAVMAVFGAPLAHEDDPQRACHAALEMHACVALLSERWRDRLGHPLTLHIGINTGRVVAGHLGSSADAAYAVTGDAVNTAARLQAAAQAGQTMVSRATFELTQREFAFEPCGTLALKGKAEALAVYRLLGVDDRPQALRGLAMHGLATPLIGRDAEIERMLAAATRVPDGRAQVVSLVGQAGVGKTRLVDALLERVASVEGFAQAPVRRVVCSPFGQRPYGVTAGLFREAYGIAPADSLDEARRKVAEVMRAIGAEDVELALVVPVIGYILGLQSLDRSHEIEPERLKRQIFMTLRTVLERRLTQGPLVLAIEDLQWGDAASIEGLHTLSDWLCERPLLVVLSGRPPFDPEGLDFGRVAHTVVRVAPLADDAIEAQLVALFGAAAAYPVERALHERIVRQAGGNPLYLEEVVRTLISDGVLTRHANGWRCVPAASTVEVPSSIEGLLLSRVDRLPVPARRTLRSAAILGSEFDCALLPAVDPEAGDPAMLDVLCDTEWLVPVRSAGTQGAQAMPHSAPRYRFASTLAHEVVYQNLLLRRRTELHQRTGVALENLHGTSPTRLEDLDALCHHFSLGEDRARGAHYLVAAGDWARGIYANDDALRYYARALAILRNVGAPDDRAIAGIREHMGDLLGPIGRRDEAHLQFGAVLELARAIEDPVREGRVQRKLAGLHWDAGARETSFECLREGLRLLECRVEAVGSDIDADIELAHIFHEIGRHAFRTGDNKGADVWARRALLQAEHAAERGRDDPMTSRAAALATSHSLNTIGAALARLGRSAEAVERIERSVAVALAAGLQQAACRSYANLGVLYATLDPGRAVQTCQLGLDTAKRIGDLAFQSRLYANLAVAFCALTQRCDDEGLQAAQSAIDLDRQLGLLDHLAIPLIVLGQIHQCHGNADKALRYYEEALALAEAMNEPQLIFPCIEGMATLCLDQGDDARAEAYFIRADEVCAKAGVERDSLVVLPFLC